MINKKFLMDNGVQCCRKIHSATAFFKEGFLKSIADVNSPEERLDRVSCFSGKREKSIRVPVRDTLDCDLKID